MEIADINSEQIREQCDSPLAPPLRDLPISRRVNMNRFGFSFLVVAALAFTSAAQSANQQYRSGQDQDHSRPAQQTKSSPSTSKQSGAQASASGSANASANAGGTSA